MITIDIESMPIVDGAPLLPEPVGCAIRWRDGVSEYYAWGHREGNNCAREDFAKLLGTIWEEDLLTHNGATFDIPILAHWFGMPEKDPLTVHDTLFLAFLHNPHMPSLSLKDMAHKLLDIPPSEQQDLIDWIIINTDCRSRKRAGAFIAYAPVELVAPYAIGDVDRTYALYEYFKDKVLPDMQEPYDRERKLAPVLVDLQNQGVRVDHEQLAADLITCAERLVQLDNVLKTELGIENIDSDAQLIEALRAKGFSNFKRTAKTGALSTSSDSLDQALVDAPVLRGQLEERAILAKLVSTYLQPWLHLAQDNDGRLHAAYNQVRNPDNYGTRTGRMSSSNPNLQNVSGDLGPNYPKLKGYLLPEDGHVWVCGDFKNQEPRIAAHFEDMALCAAFQETPTLDPYLFAADAAGGITRKQAKVVMLGILYGMGAGLLAQTLDITQEDATRIRNLVKSALPGITQLDYECKRRFQLGLQIRTLGGRLYSCEPPKDGRSFEYKALNVLIQGSAADQTKEAVIYIAERLEPGERILSIVHDEISVSCKPERVEAIMQIMREAANALPCDIPMLMDIHTGANWAEAKL